MRDRSKVINIEISENAKKIYDGLPAHVKKGQYVSDAIVEKHSRDNGTDIQQHLACDHSDIIPIYGDFETDNKEWEGLMKLKLFGCKKCNCVIFRA